MSDRILVTGGAGFIGSHLVRGLLADGATVRVFDNFSSGFRRNLEEVRNDIELQEGDLRDEDAVRRACADCAIIFHEAAILSVPRSIDDPPSSHAVNATGTLNVLMAARDAGVQRVIYASSSSIYGGSGDPCRVETDRTAPMSPYALSKYAGEAYGTMFTNLYGLEFVALRYFNVFGARQSPVSDYAAVIPKFITSMLEGSRPTIFGDGEQTRDFTYVENVVIANRLAMHTPASRAIAEAGGIFNIACGQRISLLELVSKVNGILGTDLDPVHKPARIGEVKHSQARIERAREFLGYDPQIDFDEGLARTIGYYASLR